MKHDDRLGDGRQGVALSDDLGQAVGDDLEGAHALGDLVGGLAGDVHDRVEVEVQRAEALAGDVPVQLLAHEGQSGHVGEDLLQVISQSILRTVFESYCLFLKPFLIQFKGVRIS